LFCEWFYLKESFLITRKFTKCFATAFLKRFFLKIN
jgi:hypothetical protein